MVLQLKTCKGDYRKIMVLQGGRGPAFSRGVGVGGGTIANSYVYIWKL